MLCEQCDKKIEKCPCCRVDMGKVRMWMGFSSFDIRSASRLRLLDQDYTSNEVIGIVRKSFPYLQTQPTTRLIMRKRTDGKWIHQFFEKIEIESEYFIEYMRLPHLGIDEGLIDSWIVFLLSNSMREGRTEDEIYEQCNRFTNKITSKFLARDYIHLRIEDLTKRCYCELIDGKLKYLP